MLYWIAINTGYGFITYEDRYNFEIQGKPCDVWITSDNAAAIAWAQRNNAKSITQAEAEALWADLPPIPEPFPV